MRKLIPEFTMQIVNVPKLPKRKPQWFTFGGSSQTSFHQTQKVGEASFLRIFSLSVLPLYNRSC